MKLKIAKYLVLAIIATAVYWLLCPRLWNSKDDMEYIAGWVIAVGIAPYFLWKCVKADVLGTADNIHRSGNLY